MAKSNEDMGADVGATWAQPKRFIAISLVERGRGHIREFPYSPILASVAAANGADAAMSVLDMMLSYAKTQATAEANAKDTKEEDEVKVIDAVLGAVANGTYGDASDVSGRDDFNRALLAHSRDAIVGVLRSRNIDATDANVSKAFKANYDALCALHGQAVAERGFTPTKKPKGSGAATVAPTDLGNLFAA